MRDTFRSPILTAPILFAIMLFAGFAAGNIVLAQTASWEQGLNSQYPKGTVLNVLTTGVVGTSGCNVRSTSTFKDGKLHAPGFGQNVLLGAVKCEMHPIAPGMQVYLSDMQVFQKKNRVAFAVMLCSVGDCSGGFDGALPSQVDFEFPKGFLAIAQLSQVQEAIHHVFSIASSPNAPAQGGQDAPAVSQSAPPVIPPTVTPGSLYVNSQNKADRLQLNLDNSFSLQEAGQAFTGNYSVAGASLKLHIAQLQKDVDIVVQDNALVVNGAEIWTLALAPLYVNSANSADKIQLNSDGSFTLQEGGQTFTGTYSIAGATLKLHIVQLQKDVDIAIQGNRLIVNGQENWVQPNQQPTQLSAAESGPDEKGVLEELTKIEQQIAQASINGDKETIDGYLDENCTLTQDGKSYNRAQVLAMTKPQKSITSYRIEDVNLSLNGKTAVLTGTLVFDVQSRGGKLVVKQRSVDKFVKSEGRWKVVESFVTTVKDSR